MNLTGSIASRVGPAVMTTFFPRSGDASDSARPISSTISCGSSIRPGPLPSPAASGPVPGPAIR